MRVVQSRPPNFAAIAAVFPHVTRVWAPYFAWGDIIWNPDGAEIPPQILAHEEVHGARQLAFGGPWEWWERYLADPAWRFTEELPAHQAEYAECARLWPSRAQRRAALKDIAKKFSGPLYNRMVTFDVAKRLLLERETIDPA